MNKTIKKINALKIKARCEEREAEIRAQGYKGKELKKHLNKWIQKQADASKALFRETGEVTYMAEVREYMKHCKPITQKERSNKRKSVILSSMMITAMKIM